MYSTADASAPIEARTKKETYDVSQGNVRLPETRGVQHLNVTGALNEGGDPLTIFASNRHLHRDLDARIALSGFAPAAEARVQTLAAGSIYQANSEMRPEAVVPVPSVVRVAGPESRIASRAPVLPGWS